MSYEVLLHCWAVKPIEYLNSVLRKVAQYYILGDIMRDKGLLDRFQMRVGGMLGREVLTLDTTGGGKDVAVDGGVVKGADATVVHTNLAEEHIIELGGHG